MRNWHQFAIDLVRSREIDPTYDFMIKLGEENSASFMDRFTLHYLMFYDLGGAFIGAGKAGDDDFFQYILDTYDQWPRGKARRHARASVGKGYVNMLRQRFLTPTIFWDRVLKEGRTSYDSLAKYWQGMQGCGMGPYFVWKMGDIIRNVFHLECPMSRVDFLTYLPDVPFKALKKYPGLEQTIYESICELPNPWYPTRHCSWPEVETVLCAVYGYDKGTYTFGSDLANLHYRLRDDPRLLRLLPPLIKESDYGW